VTTLADWRPWAENDDPAGYGTLSCEWPHDDEACLACQAFTMWQWMARFGPGASDRVGGKPPAGWRRAAREAFQRSYPGRFRAVTEHRRLVNRARRDAPPVAGRVVVEASKFLVLALAEARRQQIVPRRWSDPRQRSDGPWPPFWQCWEIARSEIAVPFVTTLREAYPDRFGQPSLFPFKDPEKYSTALLRAVIADNLIEHQRIAVRSRATRSILREFDRVASADGQRFTSLWVVSDVEFQAVNGATVGNVSLMGSRGDPFAARGARERVVSNLLPEALWVSERQYPTTTGSHCQGLMYASGVGPGDHWEVTRAFDREIGRLVAALQIATATTGRPQMVWTGEPSMIHVEQPIANWQPEAFMESYFRRIGTVTPEQLPGLQRLAALLERLDRQGAKTVPAVTVAIWRYGQSFRSSSWRDTVLDLATALEACLGQGTKGEIGLTLRTRAAHLLAHDDSQQANDIYTDVEDLYTLRSDIIHGNGRYRNDLPTLWKARGYAHPLESDSLHVLLDRWREIVRRSIAARLMLGDGMRLGDGTTGPALWPFTGPDVKVDRFLVRRDGRDAWRERIVSGASSYGLALLADAAPPLFDFLDARRRREGHGAT
jgi:hypothetical protein